MTSTTAVSLRRTDLPRLSVSVKAAATVLAIVAAVALPQLFHVIGAVSGRGTALGVAFLPMHLPIIFVGLIAGPAVGAIAGAAAPLASFLLSGMPMLAVLPFMMIELCAYGLVAGLLREIKLPSLVKVVIAQLAGRVVLTVATAVAMFAFGSGNSIAANIAMIAITTSSSIRVNGLKRRYAGGVSASCRAPCVRQGAGAGYGTVDRRSSGRPAGKEDPQ